VDLPAALFAVAADTIDNDIVDEIDEANLVPVIESRVPEPTRTLLSEKTYAGTPAPLFMVQELGKIRCDGLFPRSGLGLRDVYPKPCEV